MTDIKLSSAARKAVHPSKPTPPTTAPAALPDNSSSRRWILASVWAIVLLGVPLWWKTTALERRSLPEQRIQAWAQDWQDRIPSLSAASASDEADGRAVKFSPRYKLAFTLLNEDSAAGSAVLSWDAHSLLSDSAAPLLASLAPIHNFTVETQVQYFAPLAVELHHMDGEQGTYVEEADLRAFVNNAEWNLATSDTLDPVLQFLLFVPSVEHRPMRIRRQDGSTAPASFISPQRGGVVIYNPLHPAHEQPPSVPLDLPSSALRPAFAVFERQLRTLLGISVSGSDAAPLGRALPVSEVAAVAERRLREATKDTVETLAATIKLASEIQNMQINADVQKRVHAALDELDQAAATSSVISALSHVAAAQSLASRAYFDPSMMGLLYFPDEHKYAVYTPLFGPVAVPLVLALLKELNLWRNQKRRQETEGMADGHEPTKAHEKEE
ncbi:hypothetical protein JCM10908_000606 [Rhodotorula pacifica]|uniref:GPI-anchor transamidase GPI17 n=1 Tax=Rhodotorula pacifica TaxID=1495444 RepID=UPI003177D326